MPDRSRFAATHIVIWEVELEPAREQGYSTHLWKSIRKKWEKALVRGGLFISLVLVEVLCAIICETLFLAVVGRD